MQNIKECSYASAQILTGIAQAHNFYNSTDYRRPKTF